MKHYKKYFKMGSLGLLLSLYLISVIFLAKKLDTIMSTIHLENDSKSFVEFIKETEDRIGSIESSISNLVMWVAIIGILVAFLISKFCTMMLEKEELNLVKLVNRILISVGFLAFQYSGAYITTQTIYSYDVVFLNEKYNINFLSDYEVERIDLIKSRYTDAMQNGINILSLEAVTLKKLDIIMVSIN